MLPKIHFPVAARGTAFRPKLLVLLAITFLTLLKELSTFTVLPTLASRLLFAFLPDPRTDS